MSKRCHWLVKSLSSGNSTKHNTVMQTLSKRPPNYFAYFSAPIERLIDFLKALSNIIFPRYSLCHVGFGSSRRVAVVTLLVTFTTASLKEVDL